MRTTQRDERGPESKKSWDAAQERVRQRTQTGADKLESALESERGKAARYDELFRKAADKHSKTRKDEVE
jgi:hypothetical protein